MARSHGLVCFGVVYFFGARGDGSGQDFCLWVGRLLPGEGHKENLWVSEAQTPGNNVVVR